MPQILVELCVLESNTSVPALEGVAQLCDWLSIPKKRSIWLVIWDTLSFYSVIGHTQGRLYSSVYIGGKQKWPAQEG